MSTIRFGGVIIYLIPFFANGEYNTMSPTFQDIHQAEFESTTHRSNAHQAGSDFFNEIKKADQAEIDAMNMRDKIGRQNRNQQRQSETVWMDNDLADNHSGQLNQVKGRLSRRELERQGFKIEPGVLVNEIHYCDQRRFQLKYITLPSKRPPMNPEGLSSAARDIWISYTEFYDQFFQVAAVFETAYEKSGKKDAYAKAIKDLCKLSKDRSWSNIASLQPFKVKSGKERLALELDDWIVLAHRVKQGL